METALYGEAVEGVVVDVERPKPWERQEGEPTVWFRRFQRFLLQTGTRSALAVYKVERAESGANQRGSEGARAAQTVPGSWQVAMNRWDWSGRATSYDLENLQREKKCVEADRAERRRQVLADEWCHSQAMLQAASEALKHGNKFFERTTKLIQGKPELQMVTHPKTGKMVEMLVRTDREVVYIEHKLGDINRMLVDGGKKARMAVGMTTEKAQETFVGQQRGAEPMDVEQVDRDIYAMFEALGANKPVPALPQGEDDLDLPGA